MSGNKTAKLLPSSMKMFLNKCPGWWMSPLLFQEDNRQHDQNDDEEFHLVKAPQGQLLMYFKEKQQYKLWSENAAKSHYTTICWIVTDSWHKMEVSSISRHFNGTTLQQVFHHFYEALQIIPTFKINILQWFEHNVPPTEFRFQIFSIAFKN